MFLILEPKRDRIVIQIVACPNLMNLINLCLMLISPCIFLSSNAKMNAAVEFYVPSDTQDMFHTVLLFMQQSRMVTLCDLTELPLLNVSNIRLFILYCTFIIYS